MKSEKTSLPELDEKQAVSIKDELKDDAYVSSKEVDSGAELAAEAANLVLDPKEAIRIRYVSRISLW
jgi:ACS family allantoate permease-like MFS transporter